MTNPPDVSASPTKGPAQSGSMQSGGFRKWQYPDRVPGRWTISREATAYFLTALFLAGPWIEINGKPLFLMDIPERKFILFTTTFVPGDFFLLALMGLSAALSLFLFSALFGRIWCGWACPQTVFLESIYRRVEQLIEGNFRKRKARDEAHARGESQSDYMTLKVLKHIAFILMSAAFGLCFVSYFVGRDVALGLVFHPGGHGSAYVAFFGISGFMYFVAAFFRELACTFICPYARFQSVLLDKFSIVVGYDKVRGEPRGRWKRNEARTSGDCIDCERCLHVCPTGIDIRNGLQLECVNCTACMDACDEVMVKIGKPKGLIRYGSTASLEGSAGAKRGILRPRTLVYIVLLGGILLLSITQLSGRKLVHAVLLRAAGMPYIVQADGNVRNGFVVKLENRSGVEQEIQLEPHGIEGAQWIIEGSPFKLAPDSELRANLYVIVPPAKLNKEQVPFTIGIVQNGTELNLLKGEFLAPE